MTESDGDRTVDADPSALERLRRLADQALHGEAAEDDVQNQVPVWAPDHTIDAEPAVLDRLRSVAQAADPGPAWNAPPARDLSTLEVPDLGQLAAKRPPSPPAAEPWRPPERSVLPAAHTPATERPAHPMWRWAALGMGVVVLGMLGWMLFADGGDSPDDLPPGPTVSAPATGSVSTSMIEGSGG